MPVDEYIDKYRVVLDGNRIRIFDVPLQEQDDVMEFARSHKDELVSRLTLKKHNEILTKIKPDLRSIKEAESWKATQYAMHSKFLARGATPKKTIAEIDAIYEKELQKYPLAHAYVKASRMSESSNKWVRAAGLRAVWRILNGVDYNIVLHDMGKEWRDQIQKDVDVYGAKRSADPYSITTRSATGVRVAVG